MSVATVPATQESHRIWSRSSPVARRARMTSETIPANATTRPPTAPTVIMGSVSHVGTSNGLAIVAVTRPSAPQTVPGRIAFHVTVRVMPIHHTQRTQRQRADGMCPVGNTRQSRATANTIPAASTLPASATAVEAGKGETPVA